MRWVFLAAILILVAACSAPSESTDAGAGAGTTTASMSETASGTTTNTATATGAETETTTEDPHPIGLQVPPFDLVDINPSSATYGKSINSADLTGTPYALVFLDSRCATCGEVIDDIWKAYQEHPSWWAAQPTYAIQRAGALEKAPETVSQMVDTNDMPYLADTEETNLWIVFTALNHDFFSITAEGKMDVWLTLYDWPVDLPKFISHMTDRYGE